MKRTGLLLAVLLIAMFFSTSCDNDFYLSEKEFYALRSLFATQSEANLSLSSIQNRQLRVTFNNSVSPPRVQSSNLQDYLRQGFPGLAILEGGSNQALRIDRISSEIEAQFDNWLSQQIRLYQGTNNTESRLERVEELRLVFSTAPAFTYDPAGKIRFTVTAQMQADCRIRISGIDFFTNLFAGGANGTHDVTVILNNLQLRGEIDAPVVGRVRVKNTAKITFKLTPTVSASATGVQTVARNGSLSTSVADGISLIVRNSLRNPLEATITQSYDNFSLYQCSAGSSFSCHYRRSAYNVEPTLHAVVRGADNNLYSATRRDDVWSDYRPLCCSSSGNPGRFTTDPVLAVSGPRTVELAATTSTGEVYHSQYRRGWGSEHSVIPPSGTSFKGKPALVATAPGQLELFVARSDNKILHVRRTNGTWWAAQLVDLPASEGTFPNVSVLAYRDPLAVQSGNKIVFAAVSSTNRIYLKVYDLETRAWAQTLNLAVAEPVNFVPTLAASGDGRIELVYAGTSGAIYHRRLNLNATTIPVGFAGTGLTLLTEAAVPGSVSSTPALVASGYRQLGMIGRGTNNLLYYNHYYSPDSPTGVISGEGWTGWGDLNANFVGTRYYSGGTSEEFALSSTKSGKLDLLNRMRVSASAYGLHYNSFDALALGRRPAKTTLWRGSQRVGNLQANGRPALAALDNNYTVAYVGANRALYHTQLGSTITPLTGLTVLGGNTPVDPQMVTSGKGLVDVVVVADDRKLRHVRYFNNYRSQTFTLPGQTNLFFESRPTVVGFGEGQVEVVAASTTGALLHWRMINGVWQNPVTINGTASSPVLVNTGAGQMELFAIGGDNKMYRWRFLGGSWSTWQQLPSTFTINPNKFGPGAAATPGDGAVDLVVVTNQAGLLVYHRYVEPRDDTVPGPLGVPAQTFQNIGSQTATQAFVASMARNETFAMMGDQNTSLLRHFFKGTTGHSLLTPTPSGWREGISIGGTLGLRIGGIAPQPDGAVLVASGADGSIWVLDDFIERTRIEEFLLLPRQSPLTRLTTPRYQPAVASFAGP